MASQEVVERLDQLFGSSPSTKYRTGFAYDKFLRQTRKLGWMATKTLGSARQQIFGQHSHQETSATNDIDQLKEVVVHSRQVIAAAKTVVPLVFPQEVILDRTKITVIKRNFFWSSDVVSMRVEDVLNISSSVGPVFGSITISSRVMNSVDHFEIDGFWRKDATWLERIIQGYLIARQNGVPTDHLSCEELAKTLYEYSGTNVQ